MSLTKVYFRNINTNLTAFSDSITITNFGNIANRDIGELFDRSQGGNSNVSIFWQESTQSFRLAYTSSTGQENSNLSVTANANLRLGNLFADTFSFSNGTPLQSGIVGGSDTQIQFNNNGNFAGATGLTTDGVNLTASGTIYGSTINALTIGNAGASLVGTVTTSAQPQITSLGSLTGLTVAGTVDVVTVQAATIGNVGAALKGNGSQITGILGSAVVGAVDNATTAVYVTGLTGTNVNVALGYVPLDSNGTAVSAETAQYVTQATQSNITALGVLTGLTVSGTVDAVTVQAATIGNVGAAILGNGSQLTGLTGSQISGPVDNATTAVYVTSLTGTNVNVALGYIPLDSNGTAVSSGTAQYVTQSTQSNITQVGILTGLTVSGTIDSANVQAAIIGNSGAAFTGATYTATSSFNGPLNGTLGSAGGNTAIVSNLSATGNATIQALTVNTSAVFGSFLSATAGIQNTAIGNLSQNTGKFTTLEATSGLNNTIIGNVSPSSATFTFANIDGNLTSGNVFAANYYFANGDPFVSGGGFNNIVANYSYVSSGANSTVSILGINGVSTNANATTNTVFISTLPGLSGTFDFGSITDVVEMSYDMGFITG